MFLIDRNVDTYQILHKFPAMKCAACIDAKYTMISAHVGCIWLSAVKWSDYMNGVFMQYMPHVFRLSAVLWMYFLPRFYSQGGHVTDSIIAEYCKYDLISVPTSTGDQFYCILSCSFRVLLFSFVAKKLVYHPFRLHPRMNTYINSMLHCGPQ